MEYARRTCRFIRYNASLGATIHVTVLAQYGFGRCKYSENTFWVLVSSLNSGTHFL